MATFREFMKTYQIQKDDKITKPTHTRIGDTKSKIYGGSYNITKDKMSEFYKLYYERVFVENIMEYYTEKQYGYCIAVDIDLRYCYETKNRFHTKEHIENLIILYLDAIKKNYIIEPNILIFVKIFQ